MSKFEAGGDAKAISRIASERYGGFAVMFEEHCWAERGSNMMRKVQTRVKEHYSSVAAFVDHHDKAEQ